MENKVWDKSHLLLHVCSHLFYSSLRRTSLLHSRNRDSGKLNNQAGSSREMGEQQCKPHCLQSPCSLLHHPRRKQCRSPNMDGQDGWGPLAGHSTGAANRQASATGASSVSNATSLRTSPPSDAQDLHKHPKNMDALKEFQNHL